MDVPLCQTTITLTLARFNPSALTGTWSSETTKYNHGTPVSITADVYYDILIHCQFWFAYAEGLISGTNNVHAGLRTRIFGGDYGDYDDDARLGFKYIETEGRWLYVPI